MITVGLNGGLKNVPPLPTDAPLTLPLPPYPLLTLPPLPNPLALLPPGLRYPLLLALLLPYPSPPYSIPEYGATYSGKSIVPSFVIHHHFRFGWMNVLASSRRGVRASSTTMRAILRASCIVLFSNHMRRFKLDRSVMNFVKVKVGGVVRMIGKIGWGWSRGEA